MTRQYLNKLGITGNYRGHWYLEYAIDCVRRDRTLLLDATCRLYPMVGEHFGKKRRVVENVINYSLHKCWTNGNRAVLNRIAGRELVRCPKTTEFISLFVDYVDAKERKLREQAALQGAAKPEAAAGTECDEAEDCCGALCDETEK